MLEHGKYEVLCALSGTGQISFEELVELRAHLKDCPACAQLQQDFTEINGAWLTQAEGSPAKGIPSGLQSRILQGLQNAGAQFSAPALRAIPAPAAPTTKVVAWHAIAMRVPIWSVAAMFAVGALLGFGIANRRQPSPTNQSISTAVVSAETAKKPPLPAEPPTVASSEPSQAELRQELADAIAARTHTEAELKALEQQIATLQTERKTEADTIAALRSASSASQSAALAAQDQLRELKQAQASKDADIIAAQYRVRELEDKLKQLESSDSNQPALAKGGDLRELIGARNLHIIDVADVGSGGVKRPFGRVFYTEGKSLIFYAYDLSQTNGKQTFYVWGRKEGDPRSNHALGALRNDNPGQQRWVFDFDNAKVLSSIDSVYVTLEPSEKPGNQPKGRKLLNAYLGTPANHP